MEYLEIKLVDKYDNGIFYCAACGHSEGSCVAYGCGNRFRGKVLLDVKSTEPKTRLVITTKLVYQVRGYLCTFSCLEPDVALVLEAECLKEEGD